MKHYLLDTNVILRFILDDVPEQKKSVEIFFQKAKNNQVRLSIPQIVIFELDFILEKYYLIEKEVRITILKTLVSTSYFIIESNDVFLAALPLYLAESIRFVDAFLYTKSTLEEAELFTFDKKLKHIE